MSVLHPHTYDLAIIGGGASGTLLLLHLLDQTRYPVSVAVLQKGHAAAKGVAYSTKDPRHLLNVRAGRMSAYADRPDHFIEWLRKQPEYPEALGADPEKDAFVPRYLYGRYLEETLENALASRSQDFHIDWITAYATSVEGNYNYAIHTDTVVTIHATRICIATGIEAPVTLPGLALLPPDDRIHVNPWLDQMPDLKNDQDVLIIGTGLTMVDTVLSTLTPDFKGRIIALSKHGHLPMAHPAVKPAVKTDPAFRIPGDLSTLFSVIKQRIQDHPDPQGWEEPVLEDIRPYSQELWFNFTAEEKHRFLRHLQHHWSKLRHRIPFPVYLRLQQACAEGRLILHGGKISALSSTAAGINVTITSRNHSNHPYSVQRIFNCVGPVLNVEQSSNPFLRSLAGKGLIRNSASGLGPDATIDGKVIDANGNVNDRIYVLGPLMRGVVWEAVAVPEIRQGAKIITGHIAAASAQKRDVA